MNKIKFYILDTVTDFIAIFLFKCGIKPKATSFIDGETTAYGYGKLDGGIGLWQYQIPFKYNPKIEKQG